MSAASRAKGALIVVTGAAGFIGSNIATALAARGERVLAVDWLETGDKWKNLASVALHDILPPEALPAFLERHNREVGAIVHMGAISATTERDGDRLVRLNIRATLDLWEWCAAWGVRFIYASSAATYGDGAAGFDDEGDEAGLARLSPLNAYGWSKHMVDRRIARDVAEGRPAPPSWAGFKFFNVYGPGERHKGPMRSVALQLFEQISAGQPVRLFKSHKEGYGHGEQMRDFIYVKDVVAAIEWALAQDHLRGLFNLGSGKARSFLDLAKAAYAALGAVPNIEFIDTPVEIRDRYQYWTEARMERLRAAGFGANFHGLEDGVADYMRQLAEGRA